MVTNNHIKRNNNDNNGNYNFKGLAQKAHGFSILWTPIIIKPQFF